MARKPSISDRVKAALKRRFSGVDIVAVHVAPDVDQDGDRILRIEIVFDDHRGLLDAGKTSTAVRYLRPVIEQAGESGFPVISFVAKSEIGAHDAAAA